MSSRCETVVIVREDHPNRLVEINKSDWKPEDVLYIPEKPVPEPEQPVVQRPAGRKRK